MKTLFRRIFITNWKTSAAALLVLVGIGGRVAKVLDKDEMQYLIGVAVAGGLFAAKDGIREETRVAREDVPSSDNPAPPAAPDA